MTANATKTRTYTYVSDDKVADLMRALNDAMDCLYDDGRMNDVLFDFLSQDAFLAGDDFDAKEMIAVKKALVDSTGGFEDGDPLNVPAARQLIRTILNLPVEDPTAFTMASNAAVVYLRTR